ncbi:MAG: GTPase [Methylococcaceae bacterium]|jgi:GTPase Era involved in 16S rRNA processing
MAYDYSELVIKTKTWLAQAVIAGWLNPASVQVIEQLDTRSPDNLFDMPGTRPLLVAFMGGTGVGKSSLLNRLAGQAIAQTGVVRPTSREVTLYHHQSVAIQHLPEQLPTASINIAKHEDMAKKNIIWIDMPDFDSTDHNNKAQVLQWLPHIDVLIYVVSPERYRDEKAWQLLLAEGGRHAWLFVLNQWDKGQPAQFEDFNQQLNKAGFNDPIIYKTSCVDINATDQFNALDLNIQELANEHIIGQLKLRSQQVRKNELKQQLEDLLVSMGSAQNILQLSRLWQQQWEKTSSLLQQGFAWPLQQLANYYGEHAADLIGNPTNTTGNTPAFLWDDWANARFNDGLDEFILSANQLGLPILPIKNQLAVIREKAAGIIHSQTNLLARQALAKPGNLLHRSFLKLMRFCEIVLPMAAIGWVSYQVLTGYYQSSLQGLQAHYLGVDFAVHSGLLVVLSWLMPFFILKKLQPSIKKTALKGLQKGVNQSLAHIESEVLTSLNTLNQQHSQCLGQLTELLSHCQTDAAPAALPENKTLKRILLAYQK